jgi:hypothetical protein
MLVRLLRRAVALLTALAFLGGATVQAMPPSHPLSAPGLDTGAALADCGHMAMPPAQPAGSTKPMPCDPVTPDCLKAMGCIGFPSLPTPAGHVPEPVEYGRVAYSSAPMLGDGLTIEPNLLPPIAA